MSTVYWSIIEVLRYSVLYRMGITDEHLRLVITALYGFTSDSLMPRGEISLAVTMGDHPRVSIMVAEFLVVDCSSAYNTVIS